MAEKNLEISSKQMILLRGIYPPIPTPFDSKGRIAADALASNLAFLSQYDLRGFVILGSNGEYVMLTEREKFQVIEAARAVIPPDKLMIVGTGCQATTETVVLTKGAANIGADAALIITPSYYRRQMTPEVLVNHYRTIADRSPIPLLIYNMPACTGIDLDTDIIDVLSRHPNIIGLKDSSGDIVKIGSIRQQAGPGFQVLAGSGSYILPALSVGAVGGIMALANIAPAQCISIHRLFFEGKQKEAQDLQVRLIPLNTAITSRWGVPGLKAAMDTLGLYGGPVRSPLLSLSNDDKKVLDSILIKSGIKK